MKRGTIVVVAAKGRYTGKPRPAVVVQSDLLTRTHASITVCPITSDVVDAPLLRITLPPGTRTGLREPSQGMSDKVVSVPREAVRDAIGACDAAEIEAVADGLRRWLDLS